MRPPRVILLAGNDEDRVAALRYLLWAYKYSVITADTPAAAEQAMLETPIDLLLVVWPLDGAAELLEQIKAIDPHTATLVVAPTLLPTPLAVMLPSGAPADSVLFRGFCSSAAILERIKVLVAHKRGPCRGSHHAPKLDPGLDVES